MQSARKILTINSGSSSLKFSLFRIEGERRVQSGTIERIGLADGLFYVRNSSEETLSMHKVSCPDHEAAVELMLKWIGTNAPGEQPTGVGHRIVHGGEYFYRPHRITPDLVSSLKSISLLAPDHLPHELYAIDVISRLQPGIPQVACFDTAFHHDLPEPARIFALPRRLIREGIRRYGFHGLSYEYILEELRKGAGDRVARGRLIIAHLGNGASMTAVSAGKSVDTSMGMTPAGGLVMSTRCGDIDPGLILYVMRVHDLSEEDLNDLVNEQSGLMGISGISPDMKDLLEKENSSPAAAEAIALFCYQARKFVGQYAAVLGGLDTLIFTGGIGENASAIRSRICEGFSFLGIVIDEGRNKRNERIISVPSGSVTVRVMKTDEDLMIARHTDRLLQREGR